MVGGVRKKFHMTILTMPNNVYSTRGPWTAMPVLIKEIKTGQQIFLLAKNIPNLFNFMGKRTVCVCKVSHF